MQRRSLLGLAATVAIALSAAVGVTTEAGSSPRRAPITGRVVERAVAELRALPSAPPTLRQTGLYADWEAKTVAPGVVPFVPQYPLWSDGAKKRRWIRLPEGTSVDASDPQAWQFPVGTRLWKEFAFEGRVETRFMVLGASGWKYAAYVWSPDGSEASRVPLRGWTTEAEVAPGVVHVVPSEGDCRACHANAKTPVLGFSALQLSGDRDPGAPHAEPLVYGAVLLDDLVRSGRVRGLPEAMVLTPPTIGGRTPTERSARGYLHANCGSCHRTEGTVASVGLVLAEGPSGSRAVTTTEGVRSHFVPAGAGQAEAVRLVPGRPDRSVLTQRMGSRDPVQQMPPIGTRVVDRDGLELVSRWIHELGPKRVSP